MAGAGEDVSLIRLSQDLHLAPRRPRPHSRAAFTFARISIGSAESLSVACMISSRLFSADVSRRSDHGQTTGRARWR